MNHKLLLSEKERWEYFWTFFDKKSMKISDQELCGEFGYELPDDPDDDSEEFDYSIDKPFKSSFELEFPIVCIDWMEVGYDRTGEMTICCVDYVELKEFNK